MRTVEYEAIPDLEGCSISIPPKHTRDRSPLFLVISLMICVAFIVLTTFSHGYFSLEKNMGHKCKKKDILPPYLYVTKHQGTDVYKYTTSSGCLVTKHALEGGIPVDAHVQFRSMYIGEFNGNETLIIADSTKRNSRVMLYGPCDDKRKGKRSYIMDVVDELGFPFNSRRGATHPYGVTQDTNGYIYASFQDTNAVLRFMYSATTMTPNVRENFTVPGSFIPLPYPKDLPLYEGTDKKEMDYFNGTFVQLGEPSKEGGQSDMGIRAIVFVGDNLWIANENMDGIFVVDAKGKYIAFVSVTKPIGLLYAKKKDIVYASTKKGKVYAIDTNLYLVRYDLYNPFGWDHPTGMANDGTNLYIADQDQGVIYLFDMDSTLYVQRFITGLGRVEQLVLSQC